MFHIGFEFLFKSLFGLLRIHFHKFFFLNHYVVVSYPLEDGCFGYLLCSM